MLCALILWFYSEPEEAEQRRAVTDRHGGSDFPVEGEWIREKRNEESNTRVIKS